jgi:hypothetical protein
MNYRKSFIHRGVYPVESLNAQSQFGLTAAAAAAAAAAASLLSTLGILILLLS